MVRFLGGSPPPIPPDTPPPVPEGLKKVGDQINAFMPVVEQITGLDRKTLFLQLMKTGLKGGSLDTLLNGLMGKPPAPEAKFVRYVKTLALWGPLAFFLTGIAIVGLYFFTKMMVHLISTIP